MNAYGRAAGVLIAVVLTAAAGCTTGTEQAVTSSVTASSTPRSSAETSARLSAAAESGPPEIPAQGTSSAAAGFRPIPIDALPFPPPGRSPFPATQQQALQAVLDRSVADSAAAGVQGVTVAVVSTEGSWTGAAGVDGAAAPLVPTSMSDIASITKTVTAAEVLHLAQAGLVDLDAPASDYLRQPLLQRHPTVRQLLSHTSGIPNFTDNPAFFTATDAHPQRHWTAAEALAYATGPIEHPGGEMNYSNSNYLLLGMLIEKITGLTYAKAVHRDVLAGLGDRMVVQDAESPTPPLAKPDPARGTSFDGHYLPNRSTSSGAGSAGSIAADAPTLATWGYRLYGGQVLPPALTVDMAIPDGDGYGLGTEVFDPLTVGHSGNMEAYTTFLAVAPRDRLSIAILFVNTRAGAKPDIEQLLDNIRVALGIR